MRLQTATLGPIHNHSYCFMNFERGPVILNEWYFTSYILLALIVFKAKYDDQLGDITTQYKDGPSVANDCSNSLT